MRYADLSLSAQTAYAELADQVLALEMQDSLGKLSGAFHKRTLKGRAYWYFGYRDVDGSGRMIYVGPDNERVRHLVDRYQAQKALQSVGPQANAAIALGCAGVLPKHFRVIKRLAEYGFFRAGGMLIGTHAFVTYGNMLGVKWLDANRTLDVDFAHAGKNLSLALPTNVRMDVREALESLEMGLLPIIRLNGKAGAQYRNPGDAELRIDFVTSTRRDTVEAVYVPEMNLALAPLKFMEYSLENPLQACVFSKDGACMINVPAPERYAVHKLIVYGERPVNERTKARKDLHQAAALIQYLLEQGDEERLRAAWEDAAARGKGWQKRLEQGWGALQQLALLEFSGRIEWLPERG